jgi:acid phosphatase type 7
MHKFTPNLFRKHQFFLIPDQMSVSKIKYFLLLGLLLFLFTPFCLGNTDKYRIMWRSDPATTMVIGWNQISGTNPIVYYGTTDHSTNYNLYSSTKTPDRIVVFNAMNNHFARLTDLMPNTAYYFVIRDSEGTSNRFWFKTAPNDPASKLSVIAGGDSRNNRTQRINANKLVSKLRPHVVLFGGDFTASNYDAEWSDWFNDWQYTTGADGRMIPVVVARGNHESSNSIVVNHFDVASADAYYALSFAGSLLRVYTLNTEISIAGNQTTWLANDLTNNASAVWKIAQYHKPMRPHVAAKSEGNAQYQYWASLFYQHKVKVVIECDAHTVKSTWPVIPSGGSGSYEGFIRNDSEGTVYLGEGCWGAPLRLNDDDKPWTRNSGMFNQFNWILVDQQKIEARVIKTDNADNVGTVNDLDIFSPPANLDIWNPSNGPVVTIVNQETGTTPTVTVTSRITSGADDVEERSNGIMSITSSDLEMAYDNSTTGNQTIGLRFNGINIPQGTTITNAYIQFTADAVKTGTTNLTLWAENTGNVSPFVNVTNNVSGRSKTGASVNWNPVSWNAIGEGSLPERTPDLKNLIQEIVNKTTWASGNSIGFIISGTGTRSATSYEGSSAVAPLISITYSVSNAVTTSSAVSTGSDDAEERSDGGVNTGSTDLELVYDYSATGNQIVGLRFPNINVPPGSIITNAYVQFTADRPGAEATDLVLQGEAVDNASSFSSALRNVSSRTKTSSMVSWNPLSWNLAGESSIIQRTPELKAIVQETVNRPGWASGNAIGLIISGTGKRPAVAYEGSAANAPKIFISYSSGATSSTSGLDVELVPEPSEVKSKKFQVSPNPVDDKLTVNLHSDYTSNVLAYSIINESGLTIMNSSREINGSRKIEIDTSHIPPGFYILTIRTQEGTSSVKVIKK